MAERSITVVPGASLGTHVWWPALHDMIIRAYKRKDIHAFPLSWTRLNEDPIVGAAGLAAELGPKGEMLIIFQHGQPIASAGTVPFRGEDWTVDAQDPDADPHFASGEITKTADTEVQDAHDAAASDDWEVCSFAVHPEYRRQGLSTVLIKELSALVKAKGAKRLIANYSIEETGNYWPRQGFTIPVGEGTVLKKGFTHTPGKPGLLEDLHFRMAAKLL